MNNMEGIPQINPEQEKPNILEKIQRIIDILQIVKDEGPRNEIIESCRQAVEQLFSGDSLPKLEEIKEKLSTVFSNLNIELEDQGILDDKAEEVKGKIINSLVGQTTESVSDEVKEERPASGEKPETAGAAARPATPFRPPTSELRPVERFVPKQSKKEIYQELTNLNKEIEELRTRLLAGGAKWENYKVLLNSLNIRLENEKISPSLIKDWEDLKETIRQDLDLETAKAENPEYQEQKRQEQIDSRKIRITELKAKVDLFSAKFEKYPVLKNIQENIIVLEDLLKDVKSIEDLREIDEQLDQNLVEFNNLINSLKVEDVPSEVKRFLAEKLKYFDLEPQKILEKLNEEDLQIIKIMIKQGESNHLIEFFQEKIKELTSDHPEKDKLTEDKIEVIAYSINKVFEATIEAQAREELMKFDLKKAGKIAFNIGKNLLIFGGSATLAAALGLSGIGIAAGATLTAGLVRYGLEKTKKAKDKQKLYADLVKAKEEIRENIARDPKFKQNLSEIISNEIRRQTSIEAQATLNTFAKAKIEDASAIPEKAFSDIEKEFFLSATTLIKAEYPSYPEEQQKQMAYLMALTLGQHERGENESKRQMQNIQENNPKIFKYLEKINALRAGKIEKPSNLSETDWKKYLIEGGAVIGGAVIGTLARTSDVARVFFGAVGGAGAGFLLASKFEKGKLEQIYNNIETQITQASEIIDSQNLAAEYSKLKDSAIYVQSQLDLGLLDNNPFLKSRAENFLNQFKQNEFSFQKDLNKLIEEQQKNRESVQQQTTASLEKIEKSTKWKRLAGTVGGALLGGAGSLLMATDWGDKIRGIHSIDNIYNEHHGGFKSPEEFYAKVNEINLEKPTTESVIGALERIQGNGGDSALVKDLLEYYNATKHPDGIWHLTKADGSDLPVKIFNDGTVAEQVPGTDQFNIVTLEQLKNDLQGGKVELPKEELLQMKSPEEVSAVALEKTKGWENLIDNTELKPGQHDSIWRSTNQLVIAHAQEMGFKGSPQELDRWAEATTNKLVNDLNGRTSGGITDLVHQGDRMRIIEKDGNYLLNLEETSGFKAGHLPEIRELSKPQEINIEELKVEDLSVETPRIEMWQSTIADLETSRNNDLNQLDSASHEFSNQLSADEYEQLKEEINQKYNSQIDIYKKLIEEQHGQPIKTEGITTRVTHEEWLKTHSGAVGIKTGQAIELGGAKQGAYEILKVKDPTGLSLVEPGKYQAYLNDPEMVGFINAHQELRFTDFKLLQQTDQLINQRLGENLNLERLNQWRVNGYQVSALEIGNQIFSPEETIVIQHIDHPDIYLTKTGEVGYLIAGQIEKHGQINSPDLSLEKLADLEASGEKLGGQKNQEVLKNDRLLMQEKLGRSYQLGNQKEVK